jgi:hypothetical protein
MRCTIRLIAAISFSSFLFGAPLFLSAQGLETQSFDSEILAEAAGWADNGLNRDNNLGTDFGFSATDNAGGSSGIGEAGGFFPRLQTPVAFYGDTDLGGELTLDDTLAATGNLMISNLDFDGEIWLGWFDATDSPNRTDFIGLHVREPNDATRPDFRGHASYHLADGTYDVGDFVAVPEGELLEFALIYDPVGGLGMGELQIFITNRDTGDVITIVNQLNDSDRLEGAEFNAFGLSTSGGAGSNVPTRLAELYIDDLMYTSLASSLPGDFDGDGAYTCDDINTLYAGIASGDSSVDLTGDGAVDGADVDSWREEAGSAKGFSDAILLGDADLNGVVNASDLNEIALNWQITDATSWCEGDFNHDGNVNAPDLNDLALNWLSDIRPAAAASTVPEPASLGLCLMAGFAVFGSLRTRS